MSFLHRLRLPLRSAFATACSSGLAAPYQVGRSPEDPQGWDGGEGYPPSYWAFGRMRALIALEDLKRLQPGRVLEVAAGDGRLAAALWKMGCEVVVNDLRPDGLQQSLTRYGAAASITVVPGNLFDLSPSSLGLFDVVLAREVIEHVAHPDAFLAHLAGFLRPEGRLYVTTPNGRYLRSRLPTFSQVYDSKALESEQFKPDADGHLFLLTPGEVRSLAAGADLTVDFLAVFGAPLLSGHVGLSRLASRSMVSLAYGAERLTQLLPARWRSVICAGLIAVLRRERDHPPGPDRHNPLPSQSDPASVTGLASLAAQVDRGSQ